MTPSPPLGPVLQAFFVEHLLTHKNASPRTAASYRDAFRLLLTFLRETTGSEPCALRLADLDAPAILEFLEYIERVRGNSARSRNARLTALRSFFRFVTLHHPDCLAIATRVLAIPVKRVDRPLVHYLTRSEVEAILAAPDRSTRAGRRDHALLLTLYNSGARVSEIACLRTTDVTFGRCSFLQLHGKGRKERAVPVWKKTARILKTWFREITDQVDGPAFPNARGRALSRDGVAYLLKQAVQTASSTCPTLCEKRVSPHVMRHTTAMHLLQSGVDLSVIALWLGHESVETTHGYLEADLATKERALAKLAPAATRARRFKPNDSLLAFLGGL